MVLSLDIVDNHNDVYWVCQLEMAELHGGAQQFSSIRSELCSNMKRYHRFRKFKNWESVLFCSSLYMYKYYSRSNSANLSFHLATV